MINTHTIYHINNHFIQFRNSHKYTDGLHLIIEVNDYDSKVAVIAHGSKKEINQFSKKWIHDIKTNYENLLRNIAIESLEQSPFMQSLMQTAPNIAVQMNNDVNMFFELPYLHVDLSSLPLPQQVNIANQLINQSHTTNDYQYFNQIYECVQSEEIPEFANIRNEIILNQTQDS